VEVVGCCVMEGGSERSWVTCELGKNLLDFDFNFIFKFNGQKVKISLRFFYFKNWQRINFLSFSKKRANFIIDVYQ